MMTTAARHYLCSSIGRKQLVAVTGLLLCGFLVSHLLGNFLLLMGPEAFNLYAYKLMSLGGLLYLAEVGLAVIFLLHLYLAIKLNIENMKARGGVQRYAKKKNTGRGSTLMSLTMPYTGIILLLFIILHIKNLKLGTHYDVLVGEITMRDMYRTTIEYFQDIWAVVWYIFAMFCAALHTSHGFASAFQSMGWNHPKYYRKLQLFGYLYALAIGGGFAFLSVWCHLKGGY
jgi:succinate dehydrogenase / fumarate reductase, cytochrome b subunit